eukprot:COSAG05_NODE_1089_length_5920_cov_2.369009_1_plen_418_part_10
MRATPAPLGLLLLLYAPVAGSQSCQTPSGARCQVGPPSAKFPDLFVPDVHGSIKDGLPGLISAHSGTVKHVLMEFYAEWCPHCQHFAPHVERVGEAFNNGHSSSVLVCRVSCVSQGDICNHMGIRGFPTMYYGTAAQFVAAEQDWSSSGSALDHPDLDHSAVAVASWVNDKLPSREKRSLMSQTAFDTLLAKLSASAHGRKPSEAAHQLDMRGLELGMVMAVQTMITGAFDASSKAAALAFVRLMQKNTKPMGSACAASLGQLVKYIGGIEEGNDCCDDFEGLYRAWSPCGKNLEWYGSEKATWHACAGTYPTTRGFTCGLWSLFHMMMSQTTDAHASADIGAIHGWIFYFFGCQDCRQHFLEMSEHLSTGAVRSRKDAMLWLWQAHNRINLRLRQEEQMDRMRGGSKLGVNYRKLCR